MSNLFIRIFFYLILLVILDFSGITVFALPNPVADSSQVAVRLPKGMDVKAAQPVDLRGTPVGDIIKVKKNTFKVELKAFAPLSFVLE